jgi:hypothetical protein
VSPGNMIPQFLGLNFLQCEAGEQISHDMSPTLAILTFLATFGDSDGEEKNLTGSVTE